MSLDTSRRIFRHCLDVLREHRVLLLFPLLHLAASGLLIVIFLPGLFGVGRVDAWSWLWQWNAVPAGAEVFMQRLLHPRTLPFTWVAAAFLAWTLAMTFINFAFCSQTLVALNGGQVSVRRGLLLALAKLPALVAWALLSATAFLVVWRMYTASPLAMVLIGAIGVGWITRRQFFDFPVWGVVPWHVAAGFVIPVMVNEPRTMSPFGYLATSARLLRRQWDDGQEDAVVIGSVGPTSIGAAVGVCICGLAGAVGRLAHLPAIAMWGLVLGFGILFVAAGINGIFRSAMYIYASEGVPPGPFDAEGLDKVWIVRSRWSTT